MASIDHYAHELRSQLNVAAKRGSFSVVIYLVEFHRSVSKRRDTSDEGWFAMEGEMATDDDVVTAGLFHQISFAKVVDVLKAA
jgi:hypothetical protein